MREVNRQAHLLVLWKSSKLLNEIQAWNSFRVYFHPEIQRG